MDGFFLFILAFSSSSSSFSPSIRCVVDGRRDSPIEFHYFHPAVPYPPPNGWFPLLFTSLFLRFLLLLSLLFFLPGKLQQKRRERRKRGEIGKKREKLELRNYLMIGFRSSLMSMVDLKKNVSHFNKTSIHDFGWLSMSHYHHHHHRCIWFTSVETI